jgi:hypothetical protein
MHLVANGTEGDVSPNWPAQARCRPPTLKPAFQSGGPHTPGLWTWRPSPPAGIQGCLSASHAYLQAAGAALGRQAIALFRSLSSSLSGDLTLALAFRTVALRSEAVALGICDEPMIGTATAAGAADGPTRFRGFKFLGLIPVGLEEGGHGAKSNPSGCQAEKNTWLSGLVKDHGFPEFGQFSVIRIGDRYLGTVPAEVTTTAGARFAKAIGDSLGLGAEARTRVVIASHVLGFLQYVTTPEEYTAQHYEGGSTLFGPREAVAFAGILGGLAAGLRDARGASPTSPIGSLIAYPGKKKGLQKGDSVTGMVVRRVTSMTVRGDTVVGEWLDVAPRFMPLRQGPVIALVGTDGSVVRDTVWDDDQALEIRVLNRKRGDLRRWQFRWRPGRMPTRLTVRLYPHSHAEELRCDYAFQRPVCRPVAP